MKLLTKNDMRHYQQSGATHIYERNESVIFARPGGGKTVTYLTAADELLRDGEVRRVLVTAPLRVAELVWRQEAERWSHLQHLKIAVATGDRKERDAAVESGAEIVVTNHENVIDLLATWPDAGFEALAIDELSKFKGGTGKRWKPLLKLTQGFHHRCGLTGSPQPHDVADLFGAIRVIDRGRTLGRSFDVWRKANMEPRSFVAPVPIYDPKPDTLQKTMDAIRPMTFILGDKDWRPPPIRHIKVDVTLPTELRELYEKLDHDMTVEIDDDILLPGGRAQVQNKLQQLAAGFYYTYEDGRQVGRRLNYFRLDAIDDVVTSAKGDPVAIIYDYKEQLSELRRRYPDAPVLGDKTSRRQAEDAYRRWNDGKLRQIILHPASAGHGLNMQYGGHIVAWCSLPWNLDHFEQVGLRFARHGQKAAETLSYETIANNTVEDRIWASLQMRAREQNRVFNWYD
jgi:hypothetical protein